MLRAIQIDEAESLITETEALAPALADCHYILSGAQTTIWQSNAGWQLVEQAYDFENLYVCYIEVRVQRSGTYISFSCPKHDLYWLYVLRGKIQICPIDNFQYKINIFSSCYRISYMPAGPYHAKLPIGVHQLFYVVHKPRSLFRQESDELSSDFPPIRAVLAQAQIHSFSDSLPMTDGSRELITEFLQTPSCTYIRRTQLLHHLAYELVILSQNALQQSEKKNMIAIDWVSTIKTGIVEQIRAGEDVHMKAVAKRYRISVGYLRLLFDRGAGISVGAYISEQKLLHGRTLLEGGSTPTQVADYLGWNRSYFRAVFTAKFGETASSYRKRKRKH